MAVTAAVASVFVGCSKNSSESTNFPNALVTVKTATDGSCYLQLDNNNTILPTNVSKNPFGKQVRALTCLKDLKSMVGVYNNSAEVVWMDSVLTKSVVPAKSTTPPVWGYGYGADAVDVYDSWVTVLEDNYLTIRFRAYFNNSGNVHRMNLVYGGNPENPYELVFTHDSGETASYFRYSFDGIVAFDLTKIPGLTSEKSALVTVRYKSGIKEGEQRIYFAYPGNDFSDVSMVDYSGETSTVESVK